MKRTGLMIGALGLSLIVQAAQAQWTPAKRLTWTAGDSELPAIAIDSSDTLHVVWADYSPGNDEIYYKRSTDGGTTWSAAKRLTWTSGKSYLPAIATDSSNTLHVVWQDDTPGTFAIYYKRSTDGGITWSPSQRLTWTSGTSGSPAICVDSSDNLHMVSYDTTPGNSEIYYGKSTDGGTTWPTGQRLTWNSGLSAGPAVGVDSSDNLHVVWQDNTPGNMEIYHKMSADGGATWTTGKRLTWIPGDSLGPAIAIDSSGNLHVVWFDGPPGGNQIYYKNSTDGGTTWTIGQRLSWTSDGSAGPAVAIDSSGNLHVVWYWYDYTPGKAEIYYKKSTDGGTTWTRSQRLTWNSGDSYSPAIAVDSSGNLHVVWYDKTPGNYEIYYRKGK